MSAKLSIELRSGEALPAGSAVTGWVRVLEAGSSRRLTAALEYRESTSDYKGCALRGDIVALHEGDLSAGGSFEFTLALPPDAPPALSTPLGEMWWAVVVRSDKAGPDRFWMQRVDVVVPPAAVH